VRETDRPKEREANIQAETDKDTPKTKEGDKQKAMALPISNISCCIS
jgi:hypothetical protein